MEISFVCALLAAAVATSLACSPPEGPYIPDSIEKSYHYSDVVLVVRANKRMNIRRQLYDVEAQVYCIYKAPNNFRPTPTVIIKHVGHDGGMCFSSDLSVGKEYIVFLSYYADENQLTITDAQKNMTTANLRYLSTVCDTTLAHPPDVPQDKIRLCTRPQGGRNCKRFVEATGSPVGPPSPPHGHPPIPKTTPRSAANMFAPSVFFMLLTCLLAAF